MAELNLLKRRQFRPEPSITAFCMFSTTWRAAALVLALSGSAMAQTIDQSNGAEVFRFARPPIDQSFTPTMNRSTGAGLFASLAQNANITMVVTLWDGLPDASNLLATGSTTSNWGLVGATWHDVLWDTPADVTPGTEYFLRFFVPVSEIDIAYTTHNNYEAGAELHNGVASATDDIMFQTFGENVDVNPTPEPATLTLLATAFGMMLLTRRRRAA